MIVSAPKSLICIELLRLFRKALIFNVLGAIDFCY